MQELRAMDPRQLGPYWLAGRLGAGGQGVVYEGYDGAGVRVAVKALHLDAENGVADQLRREVRMLERVAPFCTAKMVAADLDHVPPYVASQYIPGPTLHQMVTTQGVYEADALVRLGVGMATALAAIHAAGVVHRDLKPENVLIGPDGPRVIDFGIARAPDLTRSTTGVIKGTPRWMAPETFQGHPATPAVDVWAWGAILVFAATGVPPFGGTDVVQIMQAVHSTEPELDALPQPLRALVARALLRDPKARPSAAELLTGLTGLNGVNADPRVGPGPVLDIEERMAAGARAAAALTAPTVAVTVGEAAEQLYASLPPAQQTLVPRVLLRLVAAAPDAVGTLRAAARSEFEDEEAAPGDPAAGDVEAVVDALLSAGVLVQDAEDGRLTLASAALVRAWTRLRDWAAEEQDALTACHELADDARRWEDHGRQNGDVLHGSALEQAVSGALTRRQHLALSRTEKAYLAASLAADRRRSRRRRQVLAIVAALVLATGGIGSYALQQSHDAAAQRKQAALQRQNAALARENAQRLAAVNDAANLAADAAAVRTRNPVIAAQLAVAAYRSAPISAATSQLLASLDSPLNGVVGDAGSPVMRMAAQADGPLVAASDSNSSSPADSHTRIWSFAAGAAPVPEAVLPGHTSGLAFVPHSSRLVASCSKPNRGLCLWDLTNPAAPALVGVLPSPTVLTHMPTAVSVSADGSLVAAATMEGSVIVWSLARPDHPTVVATVANPSTRKDGSSLAGVAFSPHGGTLLAATILGGHTTLWNLAKPAAPQLLSTLATGYQTVAISPDGQAMAAVGDWQVDAWNIATPAKPKEIGADLGTCPSDSSQSMDALTFSPDGHDLAYGSESNTSATGQICRVHIDPADSEADQLGAVAPPFSGLDFLTMAYTADGRLLSGGDDGKVRSWPTGSDRIDGLSIGGSSFTAVSPDQHLLAAPQPRKSGDEVPPIAIYDLTGAEGPRRLGMLSTPTTVQDLYFVTTTNLLTVERNGTVQLWDLSDPAHPVKGVHLEIADQHASGVFAAYQDYVSTDQAGDLLGLLSNDNRVHLWRITSAKQANELGSFPYTPAGKLTTLAVLLPDGKSAMVLTKTGLAWWNLTDPAHPVLSGSTPTDFSQDLGAAVVGNNAADGIVVAYEPAPGTEGAALHVVKVRAGAPVATASPTTMIGSQLALSDDNRLLASTGPSNDMLDLWNIADPQQPRLLSSAAMLTGVTSLAVNHAATMLAATDGKVVELWDIRNPAHPFRFASYTQPGDSYGSVSTVSFTTDGRKLIVETDSSVSFITIDPQAMLSLLCAVTGNSITPAQWAIYAPSTPYRKPCP